MTPVPGSTNESYRSYELACKNDKKVFVQSRLSFKVIGSVFAAIGIGFMSCSKKIQSSTFAFPLVCAGSLIIITLLAMTSLYAENQVADMRGYVKAHQDAIEHYEQSGKYAAALKIARSSYEDSLKRGLLPDARNFLQTVERLEKELLSLGYSRLLFDENYQPRVKLLQLLEFAGMDSLNKQEKAIVQINNWAQKNLLRQGNRWEEQTSRFEELKQKMQPLLRQLGFVDATSASFKRYEGAIVHGSLLLTVRLRLHHLVEQWKQGVRFSHLYFLSGERPLEPQKENKSTFIEDDKSQLKIRKEWLVPLEFPKTESEMTYLVWEQSEIPEEMRKEVKAYFINAPMKENSKNEKVIRPTTDDTVEVWLKSEPPPGRYLAVTNAPYTNRQDLVVRTIAPHAYGFDTIGPEANDQEKTAILLDELARFIFQVKKLSER